MSVHFNIDSELDIKTILEFLEASKNLINSLKEDLDKNQDINEKFNTNEKYLMRGLLNDSTSNINEIIRAIKRRIKQ